ncbi:MAG: DUF3997 domain-containing protein [Chitinophagales bacterium]|nr:DUF3997 domain-containing protein [Chitinophagales bacterium]
MGRLEKSKMIHLMNKNKIVVLLSILFSSVHLACNLDDSKELSGNYIYLAQSNENKSILSQTNNAYSIYPNVIDYDYNKDFIIAVQKPNREEYLQMIAFDWRSDSIKNKGDQVIEMQRSIEFADSVLNYSELYKNHFKSKLNYWIIHIKQSKKYGPYSKDLFILKCKELSVPLSLRLKE